MSLRRFAKTNGETQKLGGSGWTKEEDPNSSSLPKEGSGVSAFFKTLKNKLRRTESASPRAGMFGTGSNFFGAGNSAKVSEDKTYFVKANGQGTMARAFLQTSRPGGTSVSEYATEGDLDGVKRLLNLKGDAEDMDSEGNTALHCAAEAGHADVVDELIKRGADPNAKNEEGETALHVAAINGHDSVVKSLLLSQANYNAKNKTGWTALHEAACNGRKEVARLLLDYGADPAICTPEGDTVLHKAARWNRTEIIQLLLAVGVDVNARDNVGRTASERTNNADILQLLRSYTGTAQPRHAHEPPPRQGTDNGANNTRESNDSDISDSGSTSSQADDDRWDIADQSEFYQTQWALFASNKDADRQFSYSDVPWPGASMSPSAIVEVILHGTQGQDERRKRLRTELLRWHPDKFQAMFGRKLKADDADQIMSKVNEISQAITNASKNQ